MQIEVKSADQRVAITLRPLCLDKGIHRILGQPGEGRLNQRLQRPPICALFDNNILPRIMRPVAHPLLKDLNLALELGRTVDVPLPTTAITNEFLTAARGMGLAAKDFAIIFEVLATMSGIGPDRPS